MSSFLLSPSATMSYPIKADRPPKSEMLAYDHVEEKFVCD